MPLIEETDAAGEIRRRFVAMATGERRRNKAIRAALRLLRVRIDEELYAAVWERTAGLSPDAAAFAYALAITMRAAGRVPAHELTPRGRLGKIIGEAVAGFTPRHAIADGPDELDTIDLPPACDECARQRGPHFRGPCTH